MPKEKGTGAKNGRTFVSNVNYSDFSKCFISRLELPSLFLHRVSEKQFTFFSFAVCGGSLSGVNGSFSYKSPDVGYVHDVNCFWVVRTEERKVTVLSSV